MKCLFKIIGSFILLPIVGIVFFIIFLASLLLVPMVLPLYISGCVKLFDPPPYYVITKFGELLDWWKNL